MNPISPKPKTSRSKPVFWLVGTVITGLLIANIWLAAQLSHVGLYLSQLDNEAQELIKINTQLTQDSYQRASLHQLEQTAIDLGYTDQVTYKQLVPQKTVAQAY